MTKFEKFKDRCNLLLITLIVVLVALIPTWVYFLARFVFDPDNALVEILLLGVFFYFGGFIQIVSGIIAISLIIHLWNEY